MAKYAILPITDHNLAGIDGDFISPEVVRIWLIDGSRYIGQNGKLQEVKVKVAQVEGIKPVKLIGLTVWGRAEYCIPEGWLGATIHLAKGKCNWLNTHTNFYIREWNDNKG